MQNQLYGKSLNVPTLILDDSYINRGSLKSRDRRSLGPHAFLSRFTLRRKGLNFYFYRIRNLCGDSLRYIRLSVQLRLPTANSIRIARRPYKNIRSGINRQPACLADALLQLVSLSRSWTMYITRIGWRYRLYNLSSEILRHRYFRQDAQTIFIHVIEWSSFSSRKFFNRNLIT